jgi:preprotein translocase subunit SecE
LDGLGLSKGYLKGYLRHASERVERMAFSFREKFEGAKQFLREVKTELKKVTWPSRRDALAGTAVVLVAVFIIALFLGIVDSGLSSLIRELLKRAGS